MKQTARFIGYAIAFLGLFTVGFAWRDLQRGQLPDTRTVTTFLGIDEKGRQLSVGAQYEQMFQKVSKDYYKKVDQKAAKYASIEGMMASLGDPHTMFMEPRINQQFTIETQGNFQGIGARLAPDALGARIVVVFEDSPANRAGIKANDTVVSVDGISMAGKTTDEVANKIRGPQNTSVTLQIIRAGQAQPLSIKVTRAKIVTPTVEGRVLPETKIGYVLVTQFAQPTEEQFLEQVLKLEKQGIKGLVIDLRGNPGGLLNTASDMLSSFVSDKLVVSMKEREKTTQERTNSGQVRKWPYPIVCLINEESASAAEIFAGVLRDYGKATLVGEHTYGKASVQNVFQLRDNASVKITIARYFLPTTPDISRKVDEDGTYISGGLHPDVEVKVDPDIEMAPGDLKTDPQLQKAVQVLKSKM